MGVVHLAIAAGHRVNQPMRGALSAGPRSEAVRTSLWLALIVLGFVPGGAAAQARSEYGGSLSDLPWTFEPWEMGSLVLSAGLYAAGLVRLWKRAGVGRGVRAAEAVAFFSGLLAIVAALVSPLDALGDSLFSAHMLEHELLMMIAAPLLVLGRPLAVGVCALPALWRRGIGDFFHGPAWRRPWLILTSVWCAWLLHALALWLWHVPALFETALAHEDVHALQHICFLGTALLFWWSVLGGAHRHARGLALLSVFTTMLHTGILGALLTFSKTVWYRNYVLGSPTFGLTGLEDQQLGGIIMWVPAGLVYIACGLWLSYEWLSRSPRTHSYQ